MLLAMATASSSSSNGHDHDDRAEDLLLHRLHVRLAAGEQRRGDVEAAVEVGRAAPVDDDARRPRRRRRRRSASTRSRWAAGDDRADDGVLRRAGRRP